MVMKVRTLAPKPITSAMMFGSDLELNTTSKPMGLKRSLTRLCSDMWAPMRECTLVMHDTVQPLEEV